MEYETHSTEETQDVAKNTVTVLDSRGNKAAIVALYGDLGSGKTTFVQGAAEALGVKEPVVSPTYIILRVYKITHPRFKHFIHIDAYRLENGEELKRLGWDELAEDSQNIIFVEWAERVESILPKDAVKIYFENISESERKIKVYNSPNSPNF